MDLSQKLEILIRRKGYNKTEFADKLGITYRGLANYLNGSRSPRANVLKKIAEELSVDLELLTNKNIAIALTGEEKFIFNSSLDGKEIQDAVSFIEDSKKMFTSAELNEQDKRALYSCITEIYFGSKTNRTHK